MPTTDQLRTKLIEKLQELFQLDQPELDFGFYRIMHAKAEQVQRFLENDLLDEVKQAFADGSAGKQAELKAAYEDALAQAKKFGAPDPEKVDAVMDAKGRWTDAMDTTKAEAEVYDHLYRFFERYYEDGDFVSRRYLSRETPGKAAPYAVPYDGQEVMLHWANRDQYYIKTSEHFNTYTFEARAAARLLREEAKKNKDQSTLDLDEGLLEGEPLRVHFRIVEAAEGEHNNVKESADKKRYFIVDGTEPLAFTDAGELECRFMYQQDPEKTGQENTWRQTRNKRNEEALISALTALAKTDKRAAAYLPLLSISAPRGSKKDERTLLGKYIEKYSATNSKDYFIHKDLGGFLRRELDFYLKNEVMRLDDLEGAEAPKVEHYLAKLKVIRRIAYKLTDFLAQLENFQKRLWLKKKFVVETNYCITLDRVPETLYPDIAANAAQKTEWEKLFAIADLPDYNAKKPLTVAFLKANPYLVLDTAFLSEIEKAELLAALDDLDAQCNGLLMHSENFQALELIRTRYREEVKCIYIDPPYNTDASPIIYKNDYRDSSWLSMIADRFISSEAILSDDGSYSIAIDDYELDKLSLLAKSLFPQRTLQKVIVNHYPGSGTGRTNVSRTHEYNLFLIPRKDDMVVGKMVASGTRTRGFRRAGTGANNYRTGRPNSFFAVVVREIDRAIMGVEKPPVGSYETSNTPDGYKRIYPIGEDGAERVWSLSYEGAVAAIKRNELTCSDSYSIQRIYSDDNRRELMQSVWLNKRYNATTYGTNLLTEILGDSGLFSYPKSLYTVMTAVDSIVQSSIDSVVLDYFGGSGTTAHATIEMQRMDIDADDDIERIRRYVLVEMGKYFDQVTRPRIQRAIYSRSWSSGKPVDRDGISHCFKYIRLESYEDTLNALELRSDEEREKMLVANKELREDYTLRYLLDVETQGSTSLLNHTAFTDPRAYTITVKKPGSEESTTKTVDLLETFNYLLGLRVQHIAAPEVFTAAFERVKDEEVAKDQPMRLAVKGHLKPDADGSYWFRKVQGWMPRDRHKPHGEREKVLIIWRTLTDDLEKDNAVLDEYFTTNRIEVREKEYDVIYVNGSNNLPNLLQQGDRWKVRLIEEDFHRLMWEGAE